MTEIFTLPPKPPSLDTVLAEAGLKTGGPTKKGASFWSTFELCPYDARMIELFGYDSSDYSPALVTGVLVHECLAQWYLSYDVHQAKQPIELVRAWAERMLTSEHAAYAKMVWNSTTEAESLMNIYLGRPQHPAPFDLASVSNADFDIPRETVRMVEQVIEYKGLFEYSARIDLAVEIQDEDGPCVAIVDHKTMRTYKTEWTEAFWQDLQFVGLPYLWQKVMEPAGFPPCRYVIANGLVKSPDHPARRFVRSVYPVRQNRLAKFEVQMSLMWYRYQGYKLAEEGLVKRAPLSTLWPQQWAACQTRRYGRGSYTGDPEEVGEHLPGGGRCHRFGSCMFDEEYMISGAQAPLQELDPCTAAEQELIAQGYLKPEPTPEVLEFDPNVGLVPKDIADQLDPMIQSHQHKGFDDSELPPLEFSVGIGAPNDQGLRSKSELVPPEFSGSQVVESVGGPTTDDYLQYQVFPNADPRTPGLFYRYPIAKDQSDVISLEACSPEQYLLYQIPPGECIYLRGTVYWVTDIFEGDNRKLILPGCPTLVEFNANTLAYICAPTFRQEKPPKTPKEASKAQPQEEPSAEPENVSQAVDLDPPIGLQDGWAAISVFIPPTSDPYPTVAVVLKYKDAADTTVSRLNLDRQGFLDVIPDLIGVLEQGAVDQFCVALSKQILDLEGRPKQAAPAACGGELEVLTQAVVDHDFLADDIALHGGPTADEERQQATLEVSDQRKQESKPLEKSSRTVELNPPIWLQDGWSAVSASVPQTSGFCPVVLVYLRYVEAIDDVDTVASRVDLDKQIFIDSIPIGLVGVLEQSSVDRFCAALSRRILELEGHLRQQATLEASIQGQQEGEPSEDRQLVIPGVDAPPPPGDASLVMATPKASPSRDHHGQKVGEAPMVGVGIAPVLFVGGFTKGGVLLHPNYKDLWEKTQAPFYAAAMIGRIPDTRKLSLVGVKGPSEFEVMNKTAVGEITWKQIESSIQALKAGL